MTAQHRLLLSARCLTAGGAFLAAAAAFHFFAAHHIAPILRRAVDAKTFAFLEPIVSFTFLLNAVRGRSTERAARDFARLPGMRSRAASCQNDAYPTSPWPDRCRTDSRLA